MGKLNFVFLSAALLLAITGTVFAEDCAPVAKLTDAEKQFSMRLPNVRGMGPLLFNDIGCAVASRNNECATRQMVFDEIAAARDYASGEEIAAEKAYFVLKTDVKTPGNFGIVAFRDKAAAEAFAASHGKGKVIRWYELVDEKLK